MSPKLINTVFEGSGLFGGAEDLVAGTRGIPSAEWLDDNYFHGREHDDWVERLDELARAARGAPLPLARARGTTSRAARCAGRSSASACSGPHDRSFAGGVGVLVARARAVDRAPRPRLRRLLAGEPMAPHWPHARCAPRARRRGVTRAADAQSTGAVCSSTWRR